MAEFPRLKTGAVMQYPASKTSSFATHVLRFLDGSEQRYRDRKAVRRRWIVRLDLLDEQEAAELEQFVRAQQGRTGSFRFFDPWESVEVADCSLANEEAAVEYVRTGDSRIVLVVSENGS